MKDSKHYNYDWIKSLNRPFKIIHEETKEIKMDSKFRDIHILNKNDETIYVDRQIVGDIIVRKHRIDVVNKGAITKTILLPEYLEGIKVLID